MDNSYDLMKIYGIPPAPYSEDNPDDLFLDNLPSLEQIAMYNLSLNPSYRNENSVSPQTPSENAILPQTPATVLMPGAANSVDMGASSSRISASPSASAEFPLSAVSASEINPRDSVTKQITDFSNPFPVTAESIQYLNGFIRTQIGRRAQIQFLVGSNEVVEKDGFLLGVGANYILINEIGTNDITACDFYNIKFIRFLY